MSPNPVWIGVTHEPNTRFTVLRVMSQNAHMPEDEWIRYRIGRLRELRRSVTDAQTLRAINELVEEAEERLQALEAVRRDPSS